VSLRRLPDLNSTLARVIHMNPIDKFSLKVINKESILELKNKNK